MCRRCAALAYLARPGALEHRTERLKIAFRDPSRRGRLVAQRTQASRSRLAWCPLEYQDHYRQLRDAKRCKARGARLLIEELIAADVARYARTGQLQQTRRAA